MAVVRGVVTVFGALFAWQAVAAAAAFVLTLAAWAGVMLVAAVAAVVGG